MQSSIYVLLFLTSISSVLALPARLPQGFEVDHSRPLRFIELDARPPLKKQIVRVALKSQRKVEAFYRGAHELVVPEVQPPKEDIFLLRALEDPIFEPTAMSLNGIPRFIEQDTKPPLKKQVLRAALKAQRKAEAFCRAAHGLLIPEVKPPKDDIFLLRTLEVPIFAIRKRPADPHNEDNRAT